MLLVAIKRMMTDHIILIMSVRDDYFHLARLLAASHISKYQLFMVYIEGPAQINLFVIKYAFILEITVSLSGNDNDLCSESNNHTSLGPCGEKVLNRPRISDP